MNSASSLPLYIKIKNYLLNQIQNELSSGDKLPTESELMKQFAVSRITVNKTLTELKDEGYIVRYPSKGSFVAPKALPAAQSENIFTEKSSSSLSSPDIMCIFPYFSDQFALNIFNGITSILHPEKYVIHLIQSITSNNEDYLLKKCFQSNYKGVILCPSDQTFYSDYLLHMKLNNFPIVCIDRNLPGIDTSYVLTDNVTAGETIYRHLHILGHRNMLFVSAASRDVATSKKRISGLQKGCETANLLPNCIHIEDNVNVHDAQSDFSVYIADLLTKKRITAVICSEAYVSLWMYSLLQSICLNVPKDISLVSFDNPTNYTSDFNFFTHINQHEFHMGQKAANILLNKLNNTDSSENEYIVLSPTLEIRSSTAKIPTS